MAFLALVDAASERLVAVDAFAAGGGERRNRQRAVAEHAKIPVVVFVVIGRPLADLDIGEADVDPFAVRRRHDADLAGLGVELVRAARPVDDIESGNHIDALEGVAVKAHAQRMAVGKAQALVDVVNRGADGFGQFHRGLKADGHARGVFRQAASGFSAAMSMSAASSTTAGSGATRDGTFTLNFGSAISSFMALSCIAES